MTDDQKNALIAQRWFAIFHRPYDENSLKDDRAAIDDPNRGWLWREMTWQSSDEAQTRSRQMLALLNATGVS